MILTIVLRTEAAQQCVYVMWCPFHCVTDRPVWWGEQRDSVRWSGERGRVLSRERQRYVANC